MSYEKQTWATGDIVTSSKLNHMEDGIAGAGGGLVLALSMSEQSITGDHTFGEIKAALSAGQSFWLSVPTDEPGEIEYYPPALVVINATTGGEIIMKDVNGNRLNLLAATDEDYPISSVPD